MRYKKTITLSILVATTAMLSAFMPRQEPVPKYTNLKVLPKNISKDDLKKVMDGFKDALGVKCNFCHVPMKDDPKKLNFASDEKNHKLIARDMMKMTAKLNKKYFNHKDKEGKMKSISCVTCHNGKEEPQTIKL